MIVYGHFEWDLREAAKNLATYGVTFKEASSVFADQNCTVTQNGGSQMHAIGVSLRGRPLLVVHQQGPRVRILSAEPYDERAVRAKAQQEQEQQEQQRLEQQRLEQQRLEQEQKEQQERQKSAKQKQAKPAAAAEPEPAAPAPEERPARPRRRLVTPLPSPAQEAAPAPAPGPVAAPAAVVQVKEPKGDKPESKRRRSSASSWRAAARALGQEPEAGSPSRR